MERRRVTRGLAAILGWLPVGLLLSASTCELGMTEGKREELDAVHMQVRMLWNPEYQALLKQQAQKKNVPLPPPPAAVDPDDRTGRNPQEVDVGPIKL
jgi:hypothetical protein